MVTACTVLGIGDGGSVEIQFVGWIKDAYKDEITDHLYQKLLTVFILTSHLGLTN